MKNFLYILIITGFIYSSTLIVPDNYNTIQDAINESADGDTVLVQPGTYYENLNFNSKAILVTSQFLNGNDPAYIDQTVINGGALASVITFNSGEDSESVLQGFTITNGLTYNGAGIYCSGAGPTLKNLLITGNHAYYNGGALIGYFGSQPRLIAVTMVNNTADSNGGAIYLWESEAIIVNTISWDNLPQEIYFNQNGLPNLATIAFSDISSGETGIVLNGNGTINWQAGNLNTDPEFQDVDSADFRLSSNSPLIDAGTVLYSYNDEIIFNLDPDQYEGSLPDMGALEFIAIPGCTDVNADNYNPFANIDDGSCTYISGCTDDSAANYNPDAFIEDGSCEYAPVIEFIGPISIFEDTSLELPLIITDPDSDDLFLTVTNDTLAVNVWMDDQTLHAVPDADWFGSTVITVEASDSIYEDIETFILTVTPVVDEPVLLDPGDQIIEENTSLLLILEAIDNDNDFLAYFAESDTSAISISLTEDSLHIVPDPNWYGNSMISISVTDGLFEDSLDFSLSVLSIFDDVFIDIHNLNLDSNSVQIDINSETDILGFQMLVTGENLEIDHIRGGLVDDYGFIIQFDPNTGYILAFSPFGSVLPAGSGILFNLYFNGWGNPDLCIENMVVTRSNGLEANVVIGDCMYIEFPIGDVNDDGGIDILDVVTLIDIILAGSQGDPYQIWAGDLNYDNDLNITDIVMMIQIILES